MRLVYIDEAGTGDAAHQPYITYAGLIVDADQGVRRIESRLIELHGVVPLEHRKVPFHAVEMFNGGNAPFRRGDPQFDELREAIAPELGKIPMQFGIAVSIGVCDRSGPIKLNHDYTPRDLANLYAGTAFLQCLLQVEFWFRTLAVDDFCMLIVEDNANMRASIKTALEMIRDEEIAPELHDEMGVIGGVYPFRHIYGPPAFQAKQAGSILEVSDHCAYVYKRHLMQPTNAIYKGYASRFLPAMFRVQFDLRPQPITPQ